MGTMGEWVQVLLAGGFWGGAMAWVFARRRRLANRQPTWLLADVLTWALGGVWVGIVTTFHWQRAFPSPIAFITVPTVAAILLVGWFRRKKDPFTVHPPSS